MRKRIKAALERRSERRWQRWIARGGYSYLVGNYQRDMRDGKRNW